MADPFIGEIKIFAGNYAPRGWAMCDGQLLAISQNSALYSLLGTTYGGDGRTTFALPDLRGRIPVHAGSAPGLTRRNLGERSGSEHHTLTINEMPGHTHTAHALDKPGDRSNPDAAHWAATSSGSPDYVHTSPDSDMSSEILSDAGAGQSHANLMPYLCVNFIIALFGIFPSRS
jgi:microcystin-dependent protein